MNHNHCKHIEGLKYCEICDVAYCEKCNKEWTFRPVSISSIWTTPNVINPPYIPYSHPIAAYTIGNAFVGELSSNEIAVLPLLPTDIQICGTRHVI